MISFDPTNEEKAFTEVAYKLGRENIRLSARKNEQKGFVHHELIDQVNHLGFLAMEEPDSLGGMQLPLISQVQILEALCYGDLGTVQGFPGLGDGASVLRVMSDRQIHDEQRHFVKENSCTIAFIKEVAEEMPESRLKLAKTSNAYKLHGKSKPVRLGKIATHLIIGIKDDTGETILFWLDKSRNKWEVETCDNRLGLREASIAKLSFDEVSFSENQVIAIGNKAERILQQANTRIYILQAAKQLGLMQAALDYATEYTATREAFQQPIAKFQGVSFRIAKMVMEVKMVRSRIWQAAKAIDDRHSSAEGYALSTMFTAHKGVRFVTNSAVQLLGGHGYVQEYPVEKWMRDAQAQVILYGREREFLTRRGGQILAMTEKKVMV
ncbi:acyl-CoA dehydrogenase family protein [Pseudogracilibacillus sp. SO30301A]|uniref:acyl-CoA dehydrogenase family protein n=1 Tax=Pseudogracilibacillus sp. SO30301A TaxID=3098291 RepID=UPI00300DC228